MNSGIEKGLTRFDSAVAKVEIEEYLKEHYGYDPDAENPWDETEEEKLEDMPKPLKRFYETKDHTELISAEHAYTWVSDDLINDWMEGGDFGTSIVIVGLPQDFITYSTIKQ